jgi:hypothetical protein
LGARVFLQACQRAALVARHQAGMILIQAVGIHIKWQICQLPAGNNHAVAAIKARATERAQDVLVVIDDIRGAGVKTLQGIADELNAREIKTARVGRWHPTTVRNVLRRSH